MNAPFELPNTVEIHGEHVRINTDFRVGIQFEMALLTEDCDMWQLLSAYFPEGMPADTQAAVDAALWFYRCGKETQAEQETACAAAKPQRGYSFAQDADALCASFLQVYHIDLTREHLHWWTFRQLMFNLPQECAFMQRVYYRTGDTSGMGKTQKKYFEKMRKLYALKNNDKETLEERNARLKAYVAKRFAQKQSRPT